MIGRAISNSSCIITLGRIDRLDIVAALFSEVIVPVAVANEVGALPTWIEVVETSRMDIVSVLRNSIHLGEAEVIALAEQPEYKNAPIILDDRKARQIAIGSGLIVIGTLRLLIMAKQRKVISDVRPVIDELESVGFRIHPTLHQRILALANEQERPPPNT